MSVTMILFYSIVFVICTICLAWAVGGLIGTFVCGVFLSFAGEQHSTDAAIDRLTFMIDRGARISGALMGVVWIIAGITYALRVLLG